MSDGFKKLMRAQVQEWMNSFAELAKKPMPKKGWIRTIRDALGMSSYVLAARLGCSRNNITNLEQREQKGTISLKILQQVAKAMNCKLVYGFVPLDSLENIIKNQARDVAKKKIKNINQSMILEKQGLNPKQLKRQEDDLVEELLQGPSNKLWDN